MNKSELVDAVAVKAGLSKVQAKKAVEAVFKSVTGELMQGSKFSLIGFGTFSVVEKPARKGINPRTKQAIKIAAKKVVKFKAGAELNKAVK